MHIRSRDVASILSMVSSLGVKDSGLQKRANTTEVIPAPIVVPPSEYFEGVDGLWSTFNVRVGTPSQSVRVIASTNSPETLVVLPGGCTTKAIPKGVPNNCAFSRGGTFNNSVSTTWENQGFYGLNGGNYGFEANLEYSFNLQYGLDTLGLGYQEGADAPTLKNQTVAGFALPSPFYLGMFGLGTQPQIYETFGNYSVPSFFEILRTQNMIPGLSWSYTAGANYRLSSGQNAQLIFGGYDTSRFQPNSVGFSINSDVTRDLVAGIQSILYSGATTSTLLQSPIYAFVESTDPNIWLPSSACRLFEAAFGLVFDNATQLYLMNDTQYTSLAAQNPSVTFSLANSISGGATTNIILPFKALALKATYPFVANDSYYFPLKEAANDTQYTLGRAFLQEAYLTVDYDRGNFSISQCTWIQGASENIVSILSPSYGNLTSNSTTAPLDTSNHDTPKNANTTEDAVIGTVIGVLVIAVICAGIFYLIRRRKTARLEQAKAEADAMALTDLDDNNKDHKIFDPNSDAASTRPPTYKGAASIHSYYVVDGELPSEGREVFQLSAEEIPSEICPTFPNARSGTRHELDSPLHSPLPTEPVEIDGESRVGRELLAPGERRALRTPSPVSPLGRSHTNAISALGRDGGGSLRMPSPLGRSDGPESADSVTSTDGLLERGEG